MTEAAEDTGTGIPRAHVGVLLDEFGIVRNKLSAALLARFGVPDEDRDIARSWWRARSPDDQLRLREFLNALGSPTLIAEARLLLGRERLLGWQMVMGSMRQEDPVFLVGIDDANETLRVRRMPDVGALIDVILFHLDLGIPMGEAQLSLQCPNDDFLVALACVDLRERMFNAHLADHSVMPEEMSLADIAAAVNDGYQYAGDLRWVLPFALQAMSGRTIAPEREAIANAVSRLVDLGLLRASGERYAFSEAGISLAASLRGRLAMLLLESASATEQDPVAIQSSLFLRGDSALWFADIGGPDRPEALLRSITMPLAWELLQETFRPAYLPAPLIGVGMIENLPGGTTVDAAAGATPSAKFCRQCGTRVSPNARFCGQCGTKQDASES